MPGSGESPRPGGRSAPGWPSGECRSTGSSGDARPRIVAVGNSDPLLPQPACGPARRACRPGARRSSPSALEPEPGHDAGVIRGPQPAHGALVWLIAHHSRAQHLAASPQHDQVDPPIELALLVPKVLVLAARQARVVWMALEPGVLEPGAEQAGVGCRAGPVRP